MVQVAFLVLPFPKFHISWEKNWLEIVEIFCLLIFR